MCTCRQSSSLPSSKPVAPPTLVLIIIERLALRPGLSFSHISTSLRFCVRRLDMIIPEDMLTNNTVHLPVIELE